MSLSAALTLTDLSDYLAPSQVCIKPVEDLNPVNEPGAAQTEIRIDASGHYFEHVVASTSAPKKLEKAQITLNDCLACSGCITSAESVLVNMQSHEEVYRFLEEHPDVTPVLSVSPQSLASLAVRHSISTEQVLDGLRSFFMQKLGFRVVFDTTFARHLSLLEGQREWRERVDARDRRKGKERAADELPLPLLASACPGWICYAEKTHGELLPFASAVKSPQQIAGTLVKDWWAPQQGLTRDRVYHVSIMPCYDKKLEASRPDFQDQASVRDVDCVLTTGEVQKMLDEHAFDLKTALPVADESPLASFSLSRHAGSSSGSYLQNIVDSFLVSDPTLQLEIRPVRSDYVDYILRSTFSGSIVFKGAQCYGFRNLQNVVRKVGREVSVARGALGKASVPNGRRVVRRNAKEAPVASIDEAEARSYDYIEVMACPSGCVNGGGQLSPLATDEEGMAISAKDWLLRVEKAYWSSNDARDRRKEADALAHSLMAELGHDKLRTQYRAVEAMEVNALAVKW